MKIIYQAGERFVHNEAPAVPDVGEKVVIDATLYLVESRAWVVNTKDNVAHSKGSVEISGYHEYIAVKLKEDPFAAHEKADNIVATGIPPTDKDFP